MGGTLHWVPFQRGGENADVDGSAGVDECVDVGAGAW